MTIKYHGTPITPREQLLRMAGRFFCVSYAEPRDANVCMEIGSGCMWDNGAFSAFTRGIPFDYDGFVAWVESRLAHPHWAVIPDVIGGDVEQQRQFRARWPYPAELSAAVWHLDKPIDYLLELADEYPRICLGSTAQFWQIGSPDWCARMDEAFNALARSRTFLPWIHGLRMLGVVGNEWPLTSADSTNVAQNFKRDPGCAECMAQRIDSTQGPTTWNARPEQAPLF